VRIRRIFGFFPNPNFGLSHSFPPSLPPSLPSLQALFTGTIADNIRYGRPEATDDEVRQAAMDANAHDFIAGREGGREGGKEEGGREGKNDNKVRSFLRTTHTLTNTYPFLPLLPLFHSLPGGLSNLRGRARQGPAQRGGATAHHPSPSVSQAAADFGVG
jgi:hypothetical protein